MTTAEAWSSGLPLPPQCRKDERYRLPYSRCGANEDKSPPAASLRCAILAFGLGGYFMFGAGYIGYMTFVVALLKQQGMSPTRITVFYALLGVAVLVACAFGHACLDYFKGGQSPPS